MFSVIAFRTVAAALILGVAAPVAVSAPPAGGDHGEAEIDDKEVAKSLDLTGLVFPVFDENYKLKNYLFVNARLVVADNKDVWKFREQAHFVRDALLRQAHRSSFHMPDDVHALDVERATKECLDAGNKAVGEDAFVKITFVQIDSRG